MQAVINLSGEGVRLRPMSCQRSVGMMRIGDEPAAYHIIKNLKKRGVDNFVIITGYMPHVVEKYFKNINIDAKISFVQASMGDGVLSANAELLEDTFFYISKVVYADIDFFGALQFHKDKDSYITILTLPGVNEGVVSDKDGRVTRVEEKRLWNNLLGDQSLGIYILNRGAVRFMPKDEEVNISENILPALVRSGRNIYSKAVAGYCEGIGDFASYQRANFAYLDSLKKLYPKGIKIEEGAIVETGAILEGPCYIGKSAHVRKGSKIGAYTTLGANSVILEGANIKRSVVGRNCRIGKNAALRGCILDDNVKVGSSVTIYEQAVIGEGSNISSSALIKSFVKIWPEKNIEKGAVVSENIMWGQKKRSKLFEKGKIRGVVNVDITPMFCTLLGQCVGSMQEGGGVGISTDGSPAGAMLRDAITAGLLGSGCKVFDFGEQPLPITRRGTAFYDMNASVCITVHESEGEDVVDITLLGKDGIDIGEKEKIRLSELFEKGGASFPEGGNIKECEYVFEYKLYYLKSVVDYKKRNHGGKRVLLSCPAPWGRRLIASAMSDLCCTLSMYSPSVSDDASSKKAFQEAVSLGGFDIGFILDPTCEKLKIVLPDMIIENEYYDALTALIVMQRNKNAKIYVPNTTGSFVDHLALQYGCDVIRIKNAPREIMLQMKGREKYLSEQYAFRFDAVAAALLIMDHILTQKCDLSSLIRQIPPISMARTVVDISPEETSRALSKIKEMEHALEDSDSIKITFDKGWVRVVPDEENEIFNIVSEGATAEFARELCDICVEKILE